jgi:hypothetical protein
MNCTNAVACCLVDTHSLTPAFFSLLTVDFYLRQNAQKKADKAKEHETKVGLYKNNMYKGSL